MEFNIEKLSKFLITVEKPVYKVPLNQKFMWTGLVLLIYFLFSSQLFGHIYGVQEGAGLRFQTLQMLLGSSFGTLMTLGIGPIVTAGIVLQLLVGSKIVNWDLQDPDDKKKYEVTQKFSSVLLCFVEAIAFVLGGAVPPKSPDLLTETIVVLQLAFGGIIVIFLDEIVNKYGIGSGISLFIAAGVSNRIFIRLFTPFTASGTLPIPGNPPSGVLWGFIYGLMKRDFYLALENFLPIFSTALVFLIVVYTQAISVDIPLTFSALRGFGRRWSLKLFYTSNIPVILAAALLANFQVFGGMMAKPSPDDPNLKCSILGCYSQTAGGTTPVSGLMYYLSAPRTLLFDILKGTATSKLYLRALTYLSFMIIACIIFAIFWVNTSGMDAETVANQITSIGMQIPGYRSNPRIIKAVLNKYIPPLSVLGGALIGLIAALADFTGALGTGTGILLTVTILANFYEILKREKTEGAHPLIRKVLESG